MSGMIFFCLVRVHFKNQIQNKGEQMMQKQQHTHTHHWYLWNWSLYQNFTLNTVICIHACIARYNSCINNVFYMLVCVSAILKWEFRTKKKPKKIGQRKIENEIRWNLTCCWANAFEGYDEFHEVIWLLVFCDILFTDSGIKTSSAQQEKHINYNFLIVGSGRRMF